MCKKFEKKFVQYDVKTYFLNNFNFEFKKYTKKRQKRKNIYYNMLDKYNMRINFFKLKKKI